MLQPMFRKLYLQSSFISLSKNLKRTPICVCLHFILKFTLIIIHYKLVNKMMFGICHGILGLRLVTLGDTNSEILPWTKTIFFVAFIPVYLCVTRKVSPKLFDWNLAQLFMCYTKLVVYLDCTKWNKYNKILQAQKHWIVYE